MCGKNVTVETSINCACDANGTYVPGSHPNCSHGATYINNTDCLDKNITFNGDVYHCKCHGNNGSYANPNCTKNAACLNKVIKVHNTFRCACNENGMFVHGSHPNCSYVKNNSRRRRSIDIALMDGEYFAIFKGDSKRGSLPKNVQWEKKLVPLVSLTANRRMKLLYLINFAIMGYRSVNTTCDDKHGPKLKVSYIVLSLF